MRIRDRLGMGPTRQRQIARLMQLSLVGMLFVGLERQNPGIVINTAVALGVAQLPSLLERDYDITLDAGLTLWITGAVWLHALGTVGIPGMGSSFYVSIPGYDHLTHALSASIVAGVGYATVRALDQHSPAVHIPPPYTFVFVLLTTVAFGVVWEVLEFAIAEIAAATGGPVVLTQYDLEDTMLDLVFNTVGAVVVAIWGTAHLSGMVGTLATVLENRDERNGPE